MGQQVQKIRLPSEIVRDCQDAVIAALVAEGWVLGEPGLDGEVFSVARAVKHLGQIYGPDADVQIDIEKTPSHYQVTVTHN